MIGVPRIFSDGRVIVGAFGPQSFVATGFSYETPVLAPSSLAWRLYDARGHALTGLEWAMRGSQNYPPGLKSVIFAPGASNPGFECFFTERRCIPNWVYWLAGGLTPPLPLGSLPRGRYRLTVYAWDWVGNTSALDYWFNAAARARRRASERRVRPARPAVRLRRDRRWDMTCASCEQTTPEGRFCIRCGAPLTDGWEGRSRTRSHFAAASHQHVAHPALISTLFPHLPRASHSGFRLALALGLAVVAGLAALRLFPMALIAAALLLPLLVVLYLIDVDVYEGEPPWAVAFVILWGAAAGVGFGLLALNIAPSAVDVIVHGDSQYVLRQGLLLPFAGLLVLLVGPVLLLPLPPFQRRPRRRHVRRRGGGRVRRRSGDHLRRPLLRLGRAAGRGDRTLDLATAVARAGDADRDDGRGGGGVRRAVAPLPRPRTRLRGARAGRPPGGRAATRRGARDGRRRRRDVPATGRMARCGSPRSTSS